MKQFFVVLLACLALLAPAGLNAQTLTSADSSYLESLRGKTFAQQVAAVWLTTCQLNKNRFRDINMVQPGEDILLPLNRHYVAKQSPRSTDHVWMGSTYFVNEVVNPYLENKNTATAPKADTLQPVTKKRDYSLGGFIKFAGFMLLVIAAIGFIIWLIVSISKKIINRRSFVKNPPDLNAPDAQVRPLAEQALRATYGRDFQIVGEVERGVANGEQTMFNNDGSAEVIEFRSEPAFRARIRFNNGTEKLVVCRWSCFNPCVNRTDSAFKGTFTPDGGVPEMIENLSEKEVRDTQENIRRIARNEAPILNIPAPPAPIKEVKVKTDNRMHLTKLQISSEKGITLEGTDIPLTVAELQKLVIEVKGMKQEEKK